MSFPEAPKKDRISEAAMISIETYLRDTLIPKVGFPGSDFECHVPASGTRTRVVHVAIRDGPEFYLKLFDNFEKFFRAMYALKYFSRHDLPVPELMGHSYMGRLTPGIKSFFLIERAAPGRLYEELSDKEEGIKKIAQTLAEVHDVTRSRWGYLFAPRFGNYFDYYFKRTRRRISDLNKYEPAFGTEHAWKLEKYLLKWRDRIGKRDVFELIHARVNRENFIIDGSAVIIDLVTAAFGHFAYDLVRAVHRFCGEDDRLGRLLLDHYFAASVHSTPADYEKVYSFYHLDFHLAQSNALVRHVMGNLRDDGVPNPRAIVFKKHLEEMIRLMESAA